MHAWPDRQPCRAPWHAIPATPTPAPTPALIASPPQKVQTYVSGVNSQRGTLPWTAPEIISTPEAVTEKIDVFRWGHRDVLQHWSWPGNAKLPPLGGERARW